MSPRAGTWGLESETSFRDPLFHLSLTRAFPKATNKHVGLEVVQEGLDMTVLSTVGDASLCPVILHQDELSHLTGSSLKHLGKDQWLILQPERSLPENPPWHHSPHSGFYDPD